MTSRLDALPGRRCSVAGALDVVGEKWSLLVVREVALGSHRFSDIAAGTGAPRDRLSARLSALVEAGVLEKRPYSATREAYHLTEAGRDLLPVVQGLLQWGDRWVADSPPAVLRHTVEEHGEHDVDAAWVCRTCGQPVGHARVERVPQDPRA